MHVVVDANTTEVKLEAGFEELPHRGCQRATSPRTHHLADMLGKPQLGLRRATAQHGFNAPIAQRAL
jgi:hypothetical protein